MQPSPATPPRVPESPRRRVSPTWTYPTLLVIDGQRQLKPSHVAHHRLIFPTPPRLSGNPIEIILAIGHAEQRRTALVLPHDSDASRIPIRLM